MSDLTPQDVLTDLFDSEEWWRSYRTEFSFVRLIVDGSIVATRGTVDVGSLDELQQLERALPHRRIDVR